MILTAMMILLIPCLVAEVAIVKQWCYAHIVRKDITNGI